jgi:hypothetical protein
MRLQIMSARTIFPVLYRRKTSKVFTAIRTHLGIDRLRSLFSSSARCRCQYALRHSSEQKPFSFRPGESFCMMGFPQKAQASRLWIFDEQALVHGCFVVSPASCTDTGSSRKEDPCTPRSSDCSSRSVSAGLPAAFSSSVMVVLLLR